MEIQNNQECFVLLWLQLERTRRLLGGQYKRFCVRNILKAWFGLRATDDFIWEVCYRATATLNRDNEEPIYGNETLPPPMLCPRRHRELLRAIVAVKLNTSARKVHLPELDKAYHIAFPNSTPINVNKKPTPNPSRRDGGKV